MQGTVAVTDFGWYAHLRAHPELEEVNFWKPSAHRPFNAAELSPFFFKLKAPYSAICGFVYFARTRDFRIGWHGRASGSATAATRSKSYGNASARSVSGSASKALPTPRSAVS